MFRKFADMDEADDPLPKKLPKPLAKPLPAFFSLEEDEDDAEDERGEEEDEFEESEEEDFDEEEDEEINAILNNRSTIRPRLLFPKEAEEDVFSETEEEEEDEVEEEAETDLEEEAQAEITIVSTKKMDRSTISRLTPDSDDDFQSDKSGRRVKFKDDGDIFGPGTIPKTPRKKSIFDVKKSIFDEGESSIFNVGKSSIFDEELGKSAKEEGVPKQKRKRARGGSFDAPGLHTPRKEKKTRGAVA